MKKSLFLTLSSILVALSGCGSQTFDVVQSQQDSGAPGATSIAPKVDILLAVDNSGSTLDIQNALNAQLANFLVQLNQQNWDFRVAAIPLVGTPSIAKISASKYDANTGAGWVPPYPGAPATSSIPSWLFVAPSQFSITTQSVATSGAEPGLRNIGTVLASSEAQNYFIRKDAALAVVVISNGDDTSWAAPGQFVCPPGYASFGGQPCPVPTPLTASDSLVTSIRNAKGAALANTVHLIAAVGNGSTCYGERSSNGSRYRTAAQLIGGHSAIELCTTSMSGVLSQLKSQLSAIRLDFVKRFILLSKRPNISTIQVVKNSNGSSIALPESKNGSPGWLYLGETTRPMVSEPIEMDFRTGYMIELVGSSYYLRGSDTATVTFQEFGTQASN